MAKREIVNIRSGKGGRVHSYTIERELTQAGWIVTVYQGMAVVDEMPADTEADSKAKMRAAVEEFAAQMCDDLLGEQVES